MRRDGRAIAVRTRRDYSHAGGIAAKAQASPSGLSGIPL
jgi:hypothetical protein